MKANATQLLVILAPGLLKPLCYSLNLSFILPPTLSSLPASHSFVVTYRPCRRTPSSLNQVCFPSSHRHHSALFTPPPLSPLYPIMPWGWNRKKKKLFLFYISVLTSPSLSFYSMLWALLNTHTHRHTHVPGEEVDSRSLSAAVWLSRPVSSYCWQGGTLWRAIVGPQKSRVRCRAVGGSQWGEGTRWRGAVWRIKRTRGG